MNGLSFDPALFEAVVNSLVWNPVLFVGSLAAGGMATGLCRAATDALNRSEFGVARTLRGEMVAAGMDPAPLSAFLLGWWLTAAALVLVIWGWFGLPPLGIAAGWVAYNAAPWWMRRRVAAFRRQVSDQMAGVARNLAGQLRAGIPLPAAFAAVARDTPAPLGKHLRWTADDLQCGCSTRQALIALRTRVQVEAVGAMSVAIRVADERGGGLAEVLERLARAADEELRVARQRRTATAAGRMSILAIAVVPVVFLVMAHTIDARLLSSLAASWWGQGLMAVALVAVYLSLRWGWSMLDKRA